MPEVDELLKTFRELVRVEKIDDGVAVHYHVDGGLPDERYSEEIEVTGGGEVSVRLEDRLNDVELRAISGRVPPTLLLEWLRRFAALLDNTASPGDIEFVPESLVGVITLRVGEQRTARMFRPDEDADLLPAKIVDESRLDEVLKHVLHSLDKPLQVTEED
jgi:hypothetical protein